MAIDKTQRGNVVNSNSDIGPGTYQIKPEIDR